MVQDLITIETGKINEYLYHIDVKAYGTPRMLSIFVGQFDNGSVLIDCGSSLDTKKLIRFLKKLKIDLSSFKYLTTTHHHFDHNGGLWQLYDVLKDYNPEVKILTNQKTKELLNNYEEHLARGKRTYGNLIGSMNPIEENAFQIIEPSINFNSEADELDSIDSFTINGSEVKLGILKTPGHTPDHQCPIFVKDNLIDFIQLGESVGTIYHTSELITMPTSMPTYYNHEEYMLTLRNLKNLFPTKAGFGHFGVINGKENVRKMLLEHEAFMKDFRKAIIKFYNKKPETRYVLEQIMPMLIPRTDLSIEDNPVFKGIALGIVYGMMMDLGYRNE
jgi:glyoxylase-like metal-dependent hydrolase (beta-lactamase superfamily II)